MLNNLDFLKTGEIFPPLCEMERLQNYKDNLLLFKDSTYTVSKKVFKDSATRILRVLNDYQDLIGYPIELNYHKLTSVSLKDLICSERPTIKIKENEDIEKDLADIDFYEKLDQWVIDLSRYGDAVSRTYSRKNDDGSGISTVAVIQPNSFFKVVDVEDKDHLINVVLAIPQLSDSSTSDNQKWELNIQIHYKGYYIKRIMEIEPITKEAEKLKTLTNGRNVDITRFKIKRQIGMDEKVDTGLDDFAVQAMHQLITSDSPYGHDDYSSIDPILAEIWARLGEISIILDKHSRPDVYAAATAFEPDAKTGEWRLKTGGGNTYILNQGDPVPGYLTWDGQLVACFNQLNILFDQLYKISEMGPIYEAAGKSTNIAYDTMKASLTKPLAKAKRLTNSITTVLQKIISFILKLNGRNVQPSDVSITWYDGLPTNEKQEIENAKLKIDANLSTPEQENIDRFGLTKEQAKDLKEKVSEFNATKQQQLFGGFGTGNFDDGE